MYEIKYDINKLTNNNLIIIIWFNNRFKTIIRLIDKPYPEKLPKTNPPVLELFCSYT